MRLPPLLGLLGALLLSLPAAAKEPSLYPSHTTGNVGLEMMAGGLGGVVVGSVLLIKGTTGALASSFDTALSGKADGSGEKAANNLVFGVGLFAVGGAAYVIGAPVATAGTTVTAKRLKKAGQDVNMRGAWTSVAGSSLAGVGLLTVGKPGSGFLLTGGTLTAGIGALVQRGENLRVGKSSGLLLKRKDRVAMTITPTGEGLALVGSF